VSQRTLFEAETAGEDKITPEISNPTSTPISTEVSSTSVPENAIPDRPLSCDENTTSIQKINPPADANSKQSKPRILYCGYMKAPFAQQDKEYLSREYPVEGIDLSQMAATFRQVPAYLVKCFTDILPAVLRNDIIWIWFLDYPAVPFIVLAKLFGKKTVICHGGAELFPPNKFGYGFQNKRFRGDVSKWLARNADMNIVMSKAYGEIVLRAVPEIKVYVIPGCVDVSLYKPNYKRKEELAVTAYCDYNMSRELKGIPVFESAQKQSRIKMETLFQRPHREMIAAFLRAKVYCQLSYTEQFGMSLLEAMACGCVPVITNRGGMPEMVGNCGIIVQYGDVSETVHAISVAVHMDGERARKRAAEFTVEKKILHMKEVIRMVTCAGKRKRRE